MTSFRVLGPVEAWSDERRLVLGGPQQVKLLAFLLLNPNRAVSADAVIDALWGAERDGAGRRLQMAVFRLRKALAPLDPHDGLRLRTVSGGYLLAVDPGELDAETFAVRVRDGRRLLDGDDPASASELLAGALGLWRGPALAEVAFEDFAQAEIRRLQELRLVALETRIEADLQRGRDAELIPELEALAADQPTREHLAGQLMTALYRSGRQADALEVYQRTRTHLAEELGLEPGPAFKALQAQILEQAPALKEGFETRPPDPAPRISRRRIPSPATPTIGREREMLDITLLFRMSGPRLVTLTGPGGVGKTRLALVVARAVEHEFEDGVCWVELAGLTRFEDVGSTIVRALDVAPARGETATDTLCRSVADRQLLLVLDNFEHVLEACGLVSDLLAACPRLTVLATSREVLAIAAEHRYDVAPMPVPPRPTNATVAEVEETAATALFLAAARRHKHAFAIDPATAPLVASVCERLDGLPLAVELAAARIGVLTLSELATRLSDAVSGSGSGSRDAPERQRALRDTIRWSYHLLRDDEQKAFLGFSVFAGGATLPAAQEVCGASIETLEALENKSLLRHREQTDGTTRLVMLETLRQFAVEEDAHRADLHDARRRHFAWYLRLVEQCVAKLHTPEEPQGLDALDRDIDNIYSALAWALADAPAQAIMLARLLGDYWSTNNDPDGLAWLDAALAAAGNRASAVDRAGLHLKRAYQLSMRWQWRAAIDAGTSALGLYREASDDAGMARAYSELSVERLRLGQYAEARANAEAACDHAHAAHDDALLGRSLSKLADALPHSERFVVVDRAARLLTDAGDSRAVAQLYGNLGFCTLVEDGPERAIHFLELALAAAEKQRSPASKMMALSNMGLAQLLAGNPKDAHTALIDSLKLCTSDAFRWGGAQGLAGLAALFVVRGQLERGARLLGAAKAAGYPGPDPYDQAILDRLEHRYFGPAGEQVGSSIWTQLTGAGAEFSFDQGVAFALAEADHLDRAAEAAPENIAGLSS